MKKCIFILLIAAAACTQKPVPVASDPPKSANDRPAIAIESVGVPVMIVYAQPATDSPIIGKYGYTESIPVLAQKTDWSEIRMYDGTGWVRTSDLIDPAKAKELAKNLTPRFYVAPKEIPFRTRGEIVFQARVSTDGDVIDVTTVKNTTGNAALANANADALRAAKFFPIAEKGMRKGFTYEHTVYY